MAAAINFMRKSRTALQNDYIFNGNFAQGPNGWVAYNYITIDVLGAHFGPGATLDGTYMYQTIPGATLPTRIDNRLIITGTGSFHVSIGGVLNEYFTLNGGSKEFSLSYDTNNTTYLVFYGLPNSTITRVELYTK